MTVSANYEFEFDGVKVVDGDKLTLLKADVWESPDIRSSDQARGQQDGMFPGTDYYGAKTITLEIEVWGESESEFRTQVAFIRSALRKTPDERLLEFKLPSWTYNLASFCRCRAVRGPKIDLDHEFYVGKMIAQFVSTDPRLYRADEQSSSTGFVGVQSGRTYNLTFNRSFGGLVSSNSIFALNDGNYAAPWRAVINGPVTNPSIESVTSGKTIQIVGTVNTGEFLEITSPPFSTIMLGGTATRYVWLQDSDAWFMLETGTSEIRFNGSSAGTPTMDFYWRPAWV